MTLRRLRFLALLAATLAARAFAASLGPVPAAPFGPLDLGPVPVAAPAPPPPPERGDSVVAVVEDRVITAAELWREVFPHLDGIRAVVHSQAEFDKAVDALANDLLKDLENRILVVKDFQKDEHRRIPPSYIDNAIAETILGPDYNGDRSKFLAELNARGMTMRDYRKKVEEDIIYSVMRNQQRRSESVVSPVRIEAYYRDNKNKFFKEEEVSMRLIAFKRAPGETDVQLLAKVQPVLTRLKAGEKFDALAREFSQDPTQAKGGDYGWQKRAGLKPEFGGPLFLLAKGQTTDPIVAPEACYLLYADDRRTAGIPPLAEVSGTIEKTLSAEMAREAESRWVERLRNSAFVREFRPVDPAAPPAP